MPQLFVPKIKLNHDSATPIWSQITTEFRRNISRLRPDAGTPVISERQLAETLRIHRNTVHQAYEQLLAEQLFVHRSKRTIAVGINSMTLFRQPFPSVSLILQQKLAFQIENFSSHGLRIFGGIMDRAAEQGISVNIAALPTLDTPEEGIADWIENSILRSIGIINFGPRNDCRHDPVFEQLAQLRELPQVLVSASSPLIHLSTVTVDYFPAFRRMLDKLRQLGHSKLAAVHFSCTPLIFHNCAINRISILEKLAPEYGIELIDLPLLNALLTPETIQETVSRLLTISSRPTALWAQNDELALLLLTELEKRHIHIPEELSVIGYDNVTNGRISTATHSRDELGRLLIDVIWDLYSNGKPGEALHRQVSAEFHNYQTIGPAKK